MCLRVNSRISAVLRPRGTAWSPADGSKLSRYVFLIDINSIPRCNNLFESSTTEQNFFIYESGYFNF